LCWGVVQGKYKLGWLPDIPDLAPWADKWLLHLDDSMRSVTEHVEIER